MLYFALICFISLTLLYMNIGIDIRCLMFPNRTGVGEHTYELLNAIFKIDGQNQYFLFYNSRQDVTAHIPLWPQQNNIHYIATKWPNKLFNIAIKFLGWPKLDALISRHGHLDYFFSPNLNFTALSKNIKQILTVHDLSFKFFPQFFSTKQRLWHLGINPKKQCRRADTIIAQSENTKRDIVDYYKIQPEKIKVVYPGVRQQNPTPYPSPYRGGSYEERPASPASVPSPIRGGTEGGVSSEQVKQKYNLPNHFILFLGTVEPRKNIIGLIEAFEKCYSSLPTPYTLVLAGAPGWNNKEIYQRAFVSPLKDKIKFIGYVDADEKPALYSLADLFVYPSFYEGFGFPVLEAMACGTPVITSNRSSLPEITGQSAYLINPNRPAEMAEAMIKMLTDNTLREHFKKMGLEQAIKFSWETAANEWLKLIINP